jgi:ankyrin repeat protein
MKIFKLILVILICHTSNITGQNLWKIYDGGNQEKFIKTISQKPETISARDRDGETIMHNLCLMSQPSSSEYLNIIFKYCPDANVNIMDKNGDSPLLLAAFSGNLENVRILIEHGANVNQLGASKASPLFYASYGGYDEIVGILLKNGATVDVLTENRRTPLMIAMKNGNKYVVEDLLNAGADPDRKDSDGNTALLYACGLPISSDNPTANTNVKNEIILLLIAKGCDVNASNNDGFTPLMVASREGNADIAESLINHNANLNAQYHSGGTALFLASYNGNLRIVKSLIKAGADINLINNSGVTPLSAAKSKNQSEVVRYLKEQGAKDE